MKEGNNPPVIKRHVSAPPHPLPSQAQSPPTSPPPRTPLGRSYTPSSSHRGHFPPLLLQRQLPPKVATLVSRSLLLTNSHLSLHGCRALRDCGRRYSVLLLSRPQLPGPPAQTPPGTHLSPAAAPTLSPAATQTRRNHFLTFYWQPPFSGFRPKSMRPYLNIDPMCVPVAGLVSESSLGSRPSLC